VLGARLDLLLELGLLAAAAAGLWLSQRQGAGGRA